jgi:hypothetical protein
MYRIRMHLKPTRVNPSILLFPVQHMDMLAYFDIAVTFDANHAVPVPGHGLLRSSPS